MRELTCPGCQSHALFRVKRTFFTKLRFSNSRMYRCHDCSSRLLVSDQGDTLKTYVATSVKTGESQSRA